MYYKKGLQINLHKKTLEWVHKKIYKLNHLRLKVRRLNFALSHLMAT